MVSSIVMGTSSAKPAKLDAFVTAAGTIRSELSGRITALRTSYDSFQTGMGTTGFGVANPDLMDTELPTLLVNYQNDATFVRVVKEAFERADASLGPGGMAVVDDATFDASFAAVCRQYNIDPAVLLYQRSPVTVDAPVASGIPQTSGFVNDPICTATGHFLEAEDDFTWPDRLALLRWTRIYSSRFVAGGPFGRGWASWATVMCLLQDDGTVGYQGPDGQMAVFTPIPGASGARAHGDGDGDTDGLAYERVSGVLATLVALPAVNGRHHPDATGPNGSSGSNGGADGHHVHDDDRATGIGGWELRWDWHSDHHGAVWRFDAGGQLRSVSSPVTGTTSFHYTGGLLVAVQHDSGRRLELEWDGVRITAVRSSCGRSAHYHYNDAGDLVQVERVLGQRHYEVDDRGRIVEVRDADGVRLCRNTYDEEGRVVLQVSPFGRETILRYHPGLRTVVSDTEDGPVAVYEHDLAGRLVGLIDHYGHRMERSFDMDGRCVAATGFDGATSSNTFGSDGRAASRVGPDGVGENWSYDEHGRVVHHQVDNGPSLAFDYEGDAVLPSRLSGPDGWEMRFEYVDGMLRSLTDADGVQVRYEHDGDGNVVRVVNGMGAVTVTDPHVSGEAAQVTNPDGAVFRFERDDAGRLTTIHTPLDEQFRIEWSPAGRMTAYVEPNGARTSFESGSHGAVERMVDAMGSVMELQRDQLERLVGLSAPGGAKWGFSYTALGLLSMVTDPSGGVWEYDYDAEGRMVAATDPLGHQVRQRFNPVGRLVELVDRSGNATRYSYDALGRVVREDAPEDQVSEYEWDLWGRPTAFRLSDGDHLIYTYTPGGRVRSVTTAEGRAWTNQYDEAGRLVAVTDGAGATTQFEWDVCDRMIAAVAPTGRSDRLSYDGVGRVVAQESGGRQWHAEYDHGGRMVATTDPAGAVTRYQYDLGGRLVAATDPLGHTVRIRYDERGNATGMVDPFGGLVTTTFDGMRRPVSVTDQLGRVTRSTRDAAGRMVGQELPTGDRLVWRRDARGLATDVQLNERDVVVFDRDGAGRPRLIHEPGRNRTFTLTWSRGGRLVALDIDGRTMRWEYDRDGLRRARQDPSGRVTRFQRDGAGQVRSVAVDGWGQIELDRDADGRLVGLEAAGLHRRWDHDAGGLVVATEERWSDTRDDAAQTGPSAQGSTTTLLRDEAGRVAEVRRGAEVTRYRYDSAGQLVGAARGSEAWAWHYDPAGRMVREDGPVGTRRLSYDEAHQLTHVDGPDGRTTFTYDAAGRRVAQVGPAESRRFAWDGLDRLTGVEVVAEPADGGPSIRRQHAVDVDALGQLAAVDGVPFTWDPIGVVPELVAVGDRQLVAASGLPLALTDSADTGEAVTWLSGDGRTGVGGAGTTDPWSTGVAVPDLGGLGGLALGALGEVEIEGLTWLRSRLYDSESRQFLTPDPLPGIPGLPVACHPYHYANNNPIGFVDPLGLQPISIADYNTIREGETGVQWGNIALVAVTAASFFIPGGPLVAMAVGALVGAAPGIIQGITTGEWDGAAILRGAVIGGVAGGIGGGLAAGAARMGTSGSTFARTVALGGGRAGALGRGTFQGAASGAGAELYDLTPLPASDGQFNLESVGINAVVGAGAHGVMYHPPVRPNFVASADGVIVPTSQSRMAQGLDDAVAAPNSTVSSQTTFNQQGVRNGTEYTLPDGSRVRLMEPNATADRRASFENANGQPVDPFTGKPIQKSSVPGSSNMTKAEWKDYVRSRTHVPQDP